MTTRGAGGRALALPVALAGFSLLSVGDGVMKSMAGQWPGTGITTLRFAFGAALMGGVVLWREGRAGFRATRLGLHAARGCALAVASLCFYLAIFTMPLATATTIQFVSPMLVGLIAAVALGERMRWEGVVATVAAFAGVLIVLRPGSVELGWNALLPLASAFGLASLIVLNRMASGTASVLGSQFLVAAFCTPVLLMASVVGHLTGAPSLHLGPLPWSVAARALAIAGTASLGHTLIFAATLRVGAAEIAPMVYGQLLVALTLGAVFYGDRPDGWSLLGAAVVVGAGLFLWRRQGRRNLGGAPA